MRRFVFAAAFIMVALSACTFRDFAWFPGHEHNNFCGHAYINGVHLDPTPGDFAGAGAPWGPMWENQIRIRDPFRGDRPVPERPVPWTVPGGNPVDRGAPTYPVPSRQEATSNE